MFDEQALWSHRNALRALALDLVGDEHRAEDVVQQAWVVALERPANSVGELGAWLRGVVRNLARKSIGREVRRRDVELMSQTHAQAEASAEQDFRLRHELTGALSAMPEPYRTTLHLRYFRDRTPTQIAESGACSVETVKTRLRRGLQILRSDLDTRHEGRRELWCAPFVSMFRQQPAPVLGSALVGAPAIVSGVLIMKVLTVTLFSVFAVAALMYGINAGAGSASPLEARSLADVDAPGLGAEPAELAEPALSTSREAQTPAPSSSASTAHAPSEATVAVGRLSVIDEHGNALHGVAVSFEGDAASATSTGADGRATLELPVRRAGAEYALLFEAPGFLPMRRALKLAAGADPDLGVFEMMRGASIIGSVLDERGAPVPGAQVIVTDTSIRLWRGVARMMAQYEARQTAIADGQGRFELQGLPAGRVRVWAGAAGFVDGCSAVFQLEGARDNVDVEVRLGAAAAEDEIAGRVFLPGELEAPDLKVLYSYAAEEGVRTRSVPVAAEGTFRVQLEQRVPHDLWLELTPGTWDEQREVYTGEPALTGWRGELVESVAPGTTNLVLALARAPQLELTVTDTSGVPLETCELGVTVFSGNDLMESTAQYREVSPPLEIDVPTTQFMVSVSADGHDRVRMGPFDETSVPSTLEFELARLAPTTVRVTAYGAPLAGARVNVYWAGSGEHFMTRHGFPLRMYGALVESAISGGDGLVELTVREADRYFVLASASGWATAELGPIELGPDGADETLNLELTPGGAIEGRLLLPLGEDPTGWVLGASRGDPQLRKLAVGKDGEFRFDGLTPGEWQVARVLEGSAGTSLQSSRGPVTWTGDCSVREGRTTRFDLDLRGSVECILSGSFKVDGIDLAGAMLELRVAAEDPGKGERIDSGQLAADGTFELVADREGAYSLLVRGDSSMFLASIELEAGVNEWSSHVQTGVLSGAPDGSLLPDPTVLVWIIAEGDMLSMTRLELDDGTSFSAVVPAGAGRVHYGTPESMEDSPPPEWPVLGEVTVVPGADTEFTPED